MLGDGLTVVQDVDEESADVRVELLDLFVWVRDRSGEKWMELNAGERSVGVGALEETMFPPWTDVCGEVVNDCTPAGRIGRRLVPPVSSVAPCDCECE